MNTKILILLTILILMSGCVNKKPYPKNWEPINDNVNILKDITGKYNCNKHLLEMLKLSKQSSDCLGIEIISSEKKLIVSSFSKKKILESKTLFKNEYYKINSYFNSSSLKILDGHGWWMLAEVSGYGNSTSTPPLIKRCS